MLKFIMIIVLNLFAYLTIKLRPKLFGVKLFKPMIWNFKLSILPLLVVIGNFILFLIMGYIYATTGSKFISILSIIISVLGLLVWLLLLPNSSYLITELNLTHRNQDEKEVPIWYDIVSIMSFALSGILNTILNINIIQLIFIIIMDPDVINRKYKYILYTTAIAINILVAIGVYLGRSIRFNSWDILKPISFIKMIINHFKTKGEIRNFILFVIFHSVFFQIMYSMFNISDILMK